MIHDCCLRCILRLPSCVMIFTRLGVQVYSLWSPWHTLHDSVYTHLHTSNYHIRHECNSLNYGFRAHEMRLDTHKSPAIKLRLHNEIKRFFCGNHKPTSSSYAQLRDLAMLMMYSTCVNSLYNNSGIL